MTKIHYIPENFYSMIKDEYSIKFDNVITIGEEEHQGEEEEHQGEEEEYYPEEEEHQGEEEHPTHIPNHTPTPTHQPEMEEGEEEDVYPTHTPTPTHQPEMEEGEEEEEYPTPTPTSTFQPETEEEEWNQQENKLEEERQNRCQNHPGCEYESEGPCINLASDVCSPKIHVCGQGTEDEIDCCPAETFECVKESYLNYAKKEQQKNQYAPYACFLLPLLLLILYFIYIRYTKNKGW